MKYILHTFLVLLLFNFDVRSQEQAVLLSTWSDSTLVGSSAYDNTYNEIWGIVNNGKEYAILGSTFGTHFIDVTDPTNPIEVQVVEGGSIGPSIIHRDYHDYQGYLYAVSDEGNQSTLQIIDFTTLPDSVSVVYDSDEAIRQSHNIFIDTSEAVMYACFTRSNPGSRVPLRLFDISDPTSPVMIDTYTEFNGYRISQVHDAYAEAGIAYLNCGPSGLVIVDFTDPTEPEALAILTPNDYPQSGYNHSGWLSPDGNTYYMADETWDMDIKALDVSDMMDVTVIDTIDAGSEHRYSIPHNQVAHGDYLYSSYYYDGIQVWDISDPQNISRVVEYVTTKIPYRRNYEGAWGVYPFLPSGNFLVSDMQEGLFVFEAVSKTISVDDQLSEPFEWSISPNPSNGVFEIIMPKEGIIDQVEVFNNNGQKLYESNESGLHQIHAEAGLYHVKVSKGPESSSKQLIIVK